MMYADSREQALKERKKFEHAFGHNPKAVKTVVEHWERLTRYADSPRALEALADLERGGIAVLTGAA